MDTLTIYVVNETLPALCFKIQSASCLIGHLQEFSILEWEKMTGTKLNDTVVLSKNISGDGCRVTDKQELASNFPNRRALIITRLPIQPKYQLHSGWLWSCGDCCKGNTIMCNLKKHIEKEEHNFFFPNNRPPKVWGKEKHRSRTKVWGEPDNTSKTKPFVFERESMVKVQTSKAIATEETNGPVIHLPKNPVVTESMNSQSTPEMTTEVQSFEAIAPEDAISPVTHSPTIPVETESMDSRSTPKLTIEAVELDTNSNILPEKKDNAHSSQVDIEEIRTLVCCELCDEEVNTNLLEEHLRVCHDLTQKSYYDSFSLSRSVVAKQDHDNLPTRKSSRLLDKGPVQYDLSEDEFLLDDSEEEVICNSEEEDSEDEYESDKDYVKHKKQSTKSTTSSVQISTVKNVVKNVTTHKKGRTLFNNSMKRSLLELYIKLAANPLATGKAAMSRECINIWENESIDMDGDQIKLKHVAFSYGTLGDILYQRGKGGHTAGLSYPIFKV